MGSVSWSDIRAEYRREIVGHVILREAQEVVGQVVRRYNPVLYAGASSWNDAVDDVLQELVAGLLLAEGQLDYIMSVARDADAFRRLLVVQVRRVLARNRRRTVIDNLLDRSRRLLVSPLVETWQGPRRRAQFGIAGAADRRLSEEEIWRVARLIAVVQRVGIGRSDRAPLVYADETLAQVLRTFAREVNCRFTVSDLDKMFRRVLTDYLPESLEESDGSYDGHAIDGASPVEREAMIRETAVAMYADLSPEQRVILAGKSAGESDRSLADGLGISRPTLAKRKLEVFERIEGHLRDLERSVQVAALDQVNALLVLGEGSS